MTVRTTETVKLRNPRVRWRGPVASSLQYAGLWTLGLSGAAIGYGALTTLDRSGLGAFTLALWYLPDTIGTILPLAVFAGGAHLAGCGTAVRGFIHRWAIALAALCVLSFGLTSIAAPLIGYHLDSRRAPEDAETLYPFGAETPWNTLRRLSHVRENPPSEFVFSVEAPLQVPPNWIAHVLAARAVAAFFTIVNGLLGLALGLMASGWARGHRHRSLWALGVASATAFVVGQIFVGGIVRQSLSAPAVAWAWAPIFPAVAILVGLGVLASREGRGRRLWTGGSGEA